MQSHLGERPYGCEICGRAFTQKGNMQTHVKTHFSEKSFPCPICGKAFTLKGNMKNHMLLHSGTKPFSCEYCDKSFTQKLSLEYHQNCHTGEKPYPCEICGKCFSQKGNMKTHMHSHNGSKMHPCLVCGKGFTQRGNMKTHMKLHLRLPVEEKPFSCHICAHSFVLRSSLQCHLANHEKYMSNVQEGSTELSNLNNQITINGNENGNLLKMPLNGQSNFIASHLGRPANSQNSIIPFVRSANNHLPLGRPPNRQNGATPLGRPPRQPGQPSMSPLGRPPKNGLSNNIQMMKFPTASQAFASGIDPNRHAMISQTSTTSCQTDISMANMPSNQIEEFESRPVLTHLRNVPVTNMNSLILLTNMYPLPGSNM